MPPGIRNDTVGAIVVAAFLDFDKCPAAERKTADGMFGKCFDGFNTCAYNDNGRTLEELIRQIAALDGDFRIRLSSTEPAPDNLKLLEVMASEPKVCRFLHLALQHGSDRILQKMGRRYNRGLYADFVAGAREMIPGIHIGSDLIVGFPGETDADFEDCCAFVEKMGFANLHIFTSTPE